MRNRQDKKRRSGTAESGLNLDGQYQRNTVSHSIDSGEMAFYPEPRIRVGRGISALVRAGPQIAINRTIRKMDTQSFNSGVFFVAQYRDEVAVTP